MHTKGSVSSGSPSFDGVVAPTPTSDSKAAGVALSNKTFGAFTDTNGLISNYNAVTTNADGTCSWSGTGLGPYTPTSADGDSGVLELQARDSSNNVLATAVHVYDRAAGGASSYPDPILDWSASSETFASGAGSYTIGGLSVTLSYNGTSGPDTISLTNGVLAVEVTPSNEAYLVIDLGEDVSEAVVRSYASFDGVAAGGVSAAVFKVSANATVGNAANQAQVSLAHAGVETNIRFREANGVSSFNDVSTETVTNVTTTPTRVAITFHGASWSSSYDQGSATLPTDGTRLGTNLAPYNDGSGAVAAQDRRYLHLNIKADCTIRLASYALREIP
jgi:hypothetical protein